MGGGFFVCLAGGGLGSGRFGGPFGGWGRRGSSFRTMSEMLEVIGPWLVESGVLRGEVLSGPHGGVVGSVGSRRRSSESRVS
jgi:hypothetical protein